MFTIQQDEVMVPVIPGPQMQASTSLTCGNGHQQEQVERHPLRSRLVGVFLDGVIWFSIFAAASGFGLLAAAIYDDIRTLAGF